MPYINYWQIFGIIINWCTIPEYNKWVNIFLLFIIIVIIINPLTYRRSFRILLFAATEYECTFIRCLFKDNVKLLVAKIRSQISHFVLKKSISVDYCHTQLRRDGICNSLKRIKYEFYSERYVHLTRKNQNIVSHTISKNLTSNTLLIVEKLAAVAICLCFLTLINNVSIDIEIRRHVYIAINHFTDNYFTDNHRFLY